MDIGKQKRVIIVEPEPVDIPTPAPRQEPAPDRRSGGLLRRSTLGNHHKPAAR
jgi:hypothetical protein